MKRMGEIAIVCAIPKIVDAVENLLTPTPTSEPKLLPSGFDTPENELIATKAKLIVAENTIENFTSIVGAASPLFSSYENDLDEKPTKLVVDPNMGSWGQHQPDSTLAPAIIPKKKDIGPDPNEPINVVSPALAKKARKPRDTTTMYIPHHNYICGLHSAWIAHWNGRSRADTPTIEVLTKLLNKHMGLDKASSVYSTIWANPSNTAKFSKTKIKYPFESFSLVINETELAKL